jgi:hypothetical protein
MIDIVAKLGTWNWLILAVVLMGIETFAPGVFMLWLGIAALIVGLLSTPAFAQDATPQTGPQSPGALSVEKQETNPTTTQGEADQGNDIVVILRSSTLRRDRRHWRPGIRHRRTARGGSG